METLPIDLGRQRSRESRHSESSISETSHREDFIYHHSPRLTSGPAISRAPRGPIGYFYQEVSPYTVRPELGSSRDQFTVHHLSTSPPPSTSRPLSSLSPPGPLSAGHHVKIRHNLAIYQRTGVGAEEKVIYLHQGDEVRVQAVLHEGILVRTAEPVNEVLLFISDVSPISNHRSDGPPPPPLNDDPISPAIYSTDTGTVEPERLPEEEQPLPASELSKALENAEGLESSRHKRNASSRMPTRASRCVGQREIPGEGLCYFYDDGTYCRTIIDGQQVSPSWGITKEEESETSAGPENTKENQQRGRSVPLAPINEEIDSSMPGMLKTTDRKDEAPSGSTQISELDAVELSPSAAISVTHNISHPPHIFPDRASELVERGWHHIQELCPDSFKWDVEFSNTSSLGKEAGAWTLTPLDNHSSQNYPLTIAGAPVVIPVEYRWPPTSGVNPPPDPRPSSSIDPRAELSVDIIRDIFCTFDGCVGFYLLLNGLLQLLVPKDFDSEWASSHLPHRYGGLRVSYIPKSIISTTTPALPSDTQTSFSESPLDSQLSVPFKRKAPGPQVQNLGLNDYIEARTTTMGVHDKFAGRIGLRVSKEGNPFLIMSTHVITKAILSKPRGRFFLGLGRGPPDVERLNKSWDGQMELYAANQNIGTVEKTYDPQAGDYPDGFAHDITLVKPSNPGSISSVVSPVQGLGWMSREGWSILQRSTAPVKILGSTEDHRNAKTFPACLPSDIRIVGTGILLNQEKTIHPSRHHDEQTWNSLISRCVLYRLHPNFNPPTGYSGVGVYADGPREDGTEGPGIIGFQSFVQPTGHVQNFNMEGPPFRIRLEEGLIAFYGAFQVPEEIRKNYVIL